MRRLIAVTVTLLCLTLILCSCGSDLGNPDEKNLTGTIVRIEEDVVVVEPVESDILRQTTEEVAFKLDDVGGLDKMDGADVGDKVSVVYFGGLVGGDPPHVNARACSPIQ